MMNEYEKNTSQSDILADESAVSADEESTDLAAVDEDDYELFDGRSSREVQEQNDRVIGAFIAYLEKTGLKDPTINGHASNVSLFLDWLLTHKGESLEAGPMQIGGFLGDWFIRRCMWSSPSNIKTTAASLKKFYKFAADQGMIGAVTYKMMLDDIKENLPEWQYKCTLYNDPDLDWDDIASEFSMFPF